MAGVLVQSKFVTGTGAGTAVAADQNTLAGSAIVVIALDVSQTTTFAVSDTQGNTFNLTTSRNGGLSTSIAAWVANSKGGANTVTVTSTVSTDTIGVMVAEVSGVTAMSGSLNYPANASNNSNQTNPGTGANAITGSATTNSSTFQLGLACYESAPASNTIAAGTGFTSTASGNIHISGWSGMGLGAAPALIEWRAGVAAGTQNVTFTDATNGGANHYWDVFVCLDDFASVGDNLTPGSTLDLISYNGSNWTYISPATTNWLQVTTTGADCHTNAGGHPPTAYYGTQGSYTADQQAQFVFVSGVSGAPGGVAVRLSAGASGPTGYGAWVTASQYNIVLFNNGAVSTLIVGPLNRTNNPGDIFLFQVQGTTLTLSVNGVTLKTVTDSTVSSGNPGLAFNGQHPSSVISTFRAGSLGNNLTGQTISTVLGQVGDGLSAPLTALTATFAEGAPTENLALTLQESGQLVGQSTPVAGGTGASSGGSGSQLVWANFIAPLGGSATALNIYLNATSNIPLLYMGLYDKNGNLIGSGSIANPAVGLNTVSITPATLFFGQQYSIAWESSTAGAVVVADDGNAPNSNVFTGANPIGNPPPSTLPGANPTTIIGLPSVFVTGLFGPTAAFLEGLLVTTLPISGQTATFAEGSLTASISSGATLSLGQQTAQFNEGQLFDEIDYLLDQGATTAILQGQTATFAEGVIAPLPSPTIGAQTGTFVGGTTTSSLAIRLGADSATFTEGVISSSLGGNVATGLLGQQLVSSEGILTYGVSYLEVSNTLSIVEGTISFSATGDFTVSLTGQIALFTEGQLLEFQSGDEWVARELLMNAGLVPVVQYAEDPAVPPGIVISQSPPQGSVVPVNSPVVMVVSRGPYSPQGTAVMPNLVGLLWKDATDALAANFLSEGYFTWQANAAPSGAVISQSIVAGSPITPGTVVQLTLSAGPTIVPGTVTVPTLH